MDFVNIQRIALLLQIFINFTIKTVVSWHDLTNENYHCWPSTANEDSPTPFSVCVGLDVDWIVPPPEQVEHNVPFTASFSLVIEPEYYTWAVQDAQDGFKTNFFTYKNGTAITSSAADAQSWCEETECPTDCSKANQDNCCIHHVNVHSCPVDAVRFGLCPPWIPPDGEFYTHTTVSCGSASNTNWTTEISGLHLGGEHSTATALIAHFKVAAMHIALNWQTIVTHKEVCGDGSCSAVDKEDCTTCPSDCGRCPLSAPAIAAIVIVALVVVSVIAAGFGYVRHRSQKMLWDESWLINSTDIKPADKMVMGSVLAVSHCNLAMATSANIGGTDLNEANLGVYEDKVCYLKRVSRKQLRLTKQLRIEVKLVRSLDHTNLLPFVGACAKSPYVLILTPYCYKGNLQSVLTSCEIPISWAFRFSFANDISSGLACLHSHAISHGKLTAESCLVDDRWTIKITDYGLKSLRTADILSPLSCDRSRPTHLAPELDVGASSYEGDIFAFGIIIIQLSTRCELPASKSDVLSSVKVSWKNSVMLDNLSSDGEKCPCPRDIDMVVDHCTSEKPQMRPTINALRKQLRAVNPNRGSAVDLMMLMMEKYSKHLEKMVNEKTQDLLLEKQRTEQLLYAMLPKQVADDLRMGRPVDADQYESCTIYFSDIVGFTSLAGKCSAMDIVTFLNELYSTFDKIIDRHDVYKVETIGDAYMVVSGVPRRNGGRHSQHIANLALDILDASKQFLIPNMPDESLKIRIGLHSGPVCSGVVGLKMPRYCLFGDTVNTASRMETTGEEGRIQVSSDTASLLQIYGNSDSYCLHKRGIISVKGKGEMITWWLERNVGGCTCHSNVTREASMSSSIARTQSNRTSRTSHTPKTPIHLPGEPISSDDQSFSDICSECLY